ncbi:MAG: hypothetical protein QOH65_1072 [Methylobacteriaceae bacterium]|nr:hypothetical protein [Methylobacteriaceae bacterium]
MDSACFEAGLWLYLAASLLYHALVVRGYLRGRPESGAVSWEADQVGVVIPAYNAQSSLICMLETVAVAQRCGFRTTIVDDGSAVPLARTEFGPASLVRHTHNQGKAAALRTGSSALTASIIITVDADTVVTESALRRALSGFSDCRIGAMAMSITVAPATGKLWERFQAAEYRFIFDFERRALAALGMMFTVPGAAALWRRSAIETIDGFSGRTLSEDTDATIGLWCAGWRASVSPQSCAVTRAPSTFSQLIRQRRRWIWGNIQVAYYQLVDVGHASRSLWPAGLFAMVTGWHVMGYLLSLWGAVALVLGDFSLTALTVTCILCLSGAARLVIALHEGREPPSSILIVLTSALVMQAINTVAFTAGVLSPSIWRRRWF